MPNRPKPSVLIILDGWGIAPAVLGNAITNAKTPNFDSLIQTYPTVALQASGEAVGLPYGEAGNSEVGHTSLGAGKIVYQNLPRITQAIWNGTFFSNPAFQGAISHAQKNNSNLHLMGLVSSGGVHSYLEHLSALMDLVKRQKFTRVYIHAFLDGRDTAENSGLNFITQLSEGLRSIGLGQIATISGRFYAMDRDNHWERVSKAYNAMVLGQSGKKFSNPTEAVKESYNRKVYDEEFVPVIITDEQAQKPIATVDDNDALIFFNFRPDRAREITKAFVMDKVEGFTNPKKVKNLFFVTMTEYEKGFPVQVAFPPEQIKNPLPKILSDANLTQFHIAETEKYAHVTFFFNGGKEDEYPGEERIIIPSPSVSSYDQAPEMSADILTKKIIEEMNKQEFHFIVANYANADMVGHTGNVQAAVKAVESLDKCLGELLSAILQTTGTLVLTSDHGNCEEMYNLQTGEIMKEHTTNPVPFILAGQRWAQQKAMWPPVPHNDLSQIQPSGVLSDVAPTLLSLMGLQAPKEMTSRSLI